jgi:hypothetical protein
VGRECAKVSYKNRAAGLPPNESKIAKRVRCLVLA